MTGYSAKIPLQYDSTDGFYALNKDLKQVIQQNLKMLILTNPGERVMDINFGVGLKSLLFENRSNIEKERIYSVIIEKVNKYLPFINLTSINIADSEDDFNINENAFHVSVTYYVPSLQSEDNINFILSQNTT
jgi:phage baseplate assembly protein W